MKSRLEQLVDIPRLTRLCESFTRINQIATALLDLEGNILIATGWQDICTKFHRVNPDTACRCTESDTAIAGQLDKGERYNVYRCKNGLVDVAVPVTISGEHVGNFYTGQFLFGEPDRDFFINQAIRFNFDQTAYLEALSSVPIYTEEYVETVMGFLLELAETISEMGRERLESLENQQIKNLLEVRKLNQQLEQKHLFIEAIIDTIGDGIWDWDIPGNLVRHNQQWLDYIGVGEEYHAHPVEMFTELVHPEDQELVMQRIGDCLSNEVEIYTSEHRMIRKSGQEIWVLDRGRVIERDLEGNPLRMVGGFSDISDRKGIELAQQEATRAKDEFIAAMSHELRTPLTAIIGNSEYLLEEGVCGKQECVQSNAADLLHSIRSAGKSQLALVNDILDMSKIESGKFTIEEAPYDFTFLLQDLEHMFEIRAKDAGIKFKVDQRNEEEFLLIGDGQRVGQVLINLIGNALKFTEKGGVSLITHTEGERIFFTVEDTGIGMSPDTLDRLFSRFEQADGSISRRFGGSGLGLYISLNLAELMGGTIDFSSREGVGSIFQLILPYRRSDLKEQGIKHRGASVSVRDEKLHGHVLVAEDTLELQLLEKRILEKMGLQVTIAKNGVEAVDLATTQRFDAILMDMQMPEMDGIQATRVLRERGIDTPVIALTANVMQKHRDQFSEAGCDGFVGKPIDKGKLKRELKQYL